MNSPVSRLVKRQDSIPALRVLVECLREFRYRMSAVHVDLGKEFDSVNREISAKITNITTGPRGSGIECVEKCAGDVFCFCLLIQEWGRR